MGGEINVVLQQQRMVNWDLSLASHNVFASSLSLWGGRRSVLRFKRHTRHDRVLLEEVYRTIDNTSLLVFYTRVFPAKKAQKKRANAGGRGPRGGEQQGVQYLAVLHLTSKGEGVPCPSIDIQDTAAYS